MMDRRTRRFEPCLRVHYLQRWRLDMASRCLHSPKQALSGVVRLFGRWSTIDAAVASRLEPEVVKVEEQFLSWFRLVEVLSPTVHHMAESFNKIVTLSVVMTAATIHSSV